MKVIDIAKRIDKSKKNEDDVDIYELGNEFNLSLDWAQQDRLKSYWVGNWYCTDSWVGYKIYFLDEEPVAFSSQLGRKCDENVEWFSRDLALKVRDYLVTLMSVEEDDLSIAICDTNEEVGEGYKIEFNAQILDYDMAMLNGESIKIIERIRKEDDWGIDKMLKIQLSNGEEKEVDVEELDFKYHLATNK